MDKLWAPGSDHHKPNDHLKVINNSSSKQINWQSLLMWLKSDILNQDVHKEFTEAFMSPLNTELSQFHN